MAQQKISTTDQRPKQYKQDLADLHIAPKRKCFTCGVPTYGFECSKCQEKRHAKGY